MRIVTWLLEGTWKPCVDAAAEYADADITLLYVLDSRLAGAGILMIPNEADEDQDA